MSKKYLDLTGLETLVSIIKNTYAEQDDLTAVSTVASNAAAAATALSTSKQDTLIAGTNITIANDGKTISATDTTYSDATTSASGLMSASDKTKLNGIDAGAEENVIETVKVNGTALTPSNKAVDVTVPTKTSDLTNDSNFVVDASYTHITVDSSLSGSSSNPVENQAVHTALAGKLDTSLKGANSGLAELDASGKVPSSQLPSFVDDVVEVADGSAYVEISESLALGTTSSTAFRGDYGNIAYTHATDANKISSAVASGMYKVAGTADGHIASLTAMAASDIEGILTFAGNNDIDALFSSGE